MASRPASPWMVGIPLIPLTVVAGTVLWGHSRAAASGPLPRPDHVIVVIEENHSYAQVIGAASGGRGPIAPYMNALADQGASFTAFFAFHHPSQPNYLELFSGSNQGVQDDECPKKLFAAPSLGGALLA